MIKYTYTQTYNTSNIFDLFNTTNKSKQIMSDLQLIDKIVENTDTFDIALNLIQKCKNI
jgi:flagellar biosynthesis regulator FlbT